MLGGSMTDNTEPTDEELEAIDEDADVYVGDFYNEAPWAEQQEQIDWLEEGRWANEPSGEDDDY